METIYRDYSPKGVQFYYLYKALAHPELNGYINPVTLDERLMHIQEAKRTLGSDIPWLADTMTNDLKHAIGDRPNSEYVLDPDGKILTMRMWSIPEDLRRDLAEFVGPVENPTQVADLGMKTAEPPKHAETGIVPRLDRQGQYRPVVARPQLDKTDEPFYVKLRAEADQDLLRDGKGKLYLGFILDPLYGVHWNNLAPAMDVELFPPDGATISPSKLKGPEVEAEADADPREFLVDVDLRNATEPVRVKFRYFACTDKWCRPVTQEYLVSRQLDRDGGRVFSGRGGGPGRQGGPGGFGPPGSPQFIERLMQGDADGDDRLTQDEIPQQMRQRFAMMDEDGDGYIEPAELESLSSRMRSQRPGGPGGGPAQLMSRDANGDGKLTMEELPEPARQRFSQMDANADGFIDQTELDEFVRRRGGSRP